MKTYPTLHSLLDELFDLQEQLGEIESQYQSEVALFGDAWPGAQLQLASLRGSLYSLQQRINEHPDYPRYLSEQQSLDEDIPF